MTAESKGIIRKAQTLGHPYSGTGIVGGTNCPRAFLLCWSGKTRFRGAKTGIVLKNLKNYPRAKPMSGAEFLNHKNHNGDSGDRFRVFANFSQDSPHYPRRKFIRSICDYKIVYSTAVFDDIYNVRNEGDSFLKLPPCQNPLFKVTDSIDNSLGRLNIAIYMSKEMRGQFLELSPRYPANGGVGGR